MHKLIFSRGHTLLWGHIPGASVSLSLLYIKVVRSEETEEETEEEEEEEENNFLSWNVKDLEKIYRMSRTTLQSDCIC